MRSRSFYIRKTAGYAVLSLGAAACLLPLLRQIRSSFMPMTDIFKLPLILLPRSFDLKNYFDVFILVPFARYYANTIIVVSVNIIGALVFQAWRMSLIDPDGEYADVIERAIYNGALSGVSLDGERYFYVNPLETVPEVAAYRHDHSHVATHRGKWFACACCPTNIARLVASIGGYIASYAGDAVRIHQYMSSEIDLSAANTRVKIGQETAYPRNGTVGLTVEPEAPAAFSLFLRIPGWCAAFNVRVNGQPVERPVIEKGYLRLDRVWKPGDAVTLAPDMPARFVRANTRVRDLAGKVALTRGPLVYCIEQIDNGADLHELLVDPSSTVREETADVCGEGTTVLLIDGYRDEPGTEDGDELYVQYDRTRKPASFAVKAVPYFIWGNRVPDQEMRVWLRSKS